MIISDLIPLLLFTTIYANYYNHTTLLGPIISRLFSLVYHTAANDPTLPSLLILDHLGICSMALSVPAACAMAEEGWGVQVCGVFNVATAVVLGCAVVELCVHSGLGRTFVFRNPEHAILSLALIGNAPVAAIIACPTILVHQRILFAFSLVSFATGYFLLKPAHHVLWHWAAAAAQAAGVAAVVGGRQSFH